MACVNKVMLIGNLGQDPEVRYMPNGDAVCDLSIATTEKWKDKHSGEKQQRTEWHRVVLFQRLAEIAGEYLTKGSPVYIEGSLRTRKWQDKNGQDRYTTEITATQMQLLGGNQEKPESKEQPQYQPAPLTRINAYEAAKNGRTQYPAPSQLPPHPSQLQYQPAPPPPQYMRDLDNSIPF